MAAELAKLDYPFIYTEVPGVGHGVARPEEVIPWMLRQKKTRNPRRVTFATYELRHNSSHWITVEQIRTYGQKAAVDASLEPGDAIRINSENILALTLRPPEGIKNTAIILDGQNLGTNDLSEPQSFGKTAASDRWEPISGGFPVQKRHDSSGPFSDLFYHGLVMVPGESGTEEETHFNVLLAANSARYFNERNGGVHRGGIMGENSVNLPIIPDRKLSEELMRSRNLLLFGTFSSNSVLKGFKGRIPLELNGDTIRLCGHTYTNKYAAVIAVFPHPDNPDRYVAVHGGLTPDAIAWGSHLDLQLLPDYLVYSKGDVIDWGFWDNDWR